MIVKVAIDFCIEREISNKYITNGEITDENLYDLLNTEKDLLIPQSENEITEAIANDGVVAMIGDSKYNIIAEI